MEFETGEEVVWKGSPASHIRYPILTLLFFAGIFVIKLGPVGQAIAVTSLFLFLLFLIVTFVSLIVDKEKKYYLTNRRVISHKASLLVPDLTNVRLEQSRLARLRGAGNVYFDSKDGRWIVFKHVKDPEQLVNSGLTLTGRAANQVTSRICSYCGAKVPASASKCPTCGADIGPSRTG